MTRKRRSARERERLFILHCETCYLCGVIIGPNERWQLEHVIPWELTRDESDDNVKPAHVACHKIKTAEDIRSIRKADRQRQKSYGIRAPSKFANSRGGRFKTTIGGRTVERPQP